MASLNFLTSYSSNVEDVTTSSTSIRLFVDDKGLCSTIIRSIDVGQTCTNDEDLVYTDKDLSNVAPDGYYYFSGRILNIINGHLQ